ncbi:hypothetical protein P3T76_001351 [Phytophthora citrophthora]|uniref:WW domain-containing protein n=1 Tax=Phytophthora citrophthora TaxID=4793 RepID=A0AAD9H0J6_9STRA|nr:hypothetical protein P3T76_001351 [Phytophthora citrophthora]
MLYICDHRQFNRPIRHFTRPCNCPMPPKSAVGGERLKKELAAQKARAEALKYLQSTGSGPSQRELTQQQQLRQKQTANATTSVAQRRVLGSQLKEPSAADKFDPRVRDNTLHAVALRRAQDMQKTQQIEQQTESFRMESCSTEYNALPPFWQEVVDPTSGDVYYWNESTNETAWERPGSSTEEPTEVKATESKTTGDQLAEILRFMLALSRDWEEVRDPASGDVYFWNRTTNETSWERPVARSVSLAQALEAKAKLDNILKNCGNPVHAKTSNATQRSNSSSNKRPAADTQLPDTKRRKHADGAIDPMNPQGKMMESNFQRAASRTGQLRGNSSAKGSLSPKGAIKKKKLDRKAKERQVQELCLLNVLIGRLEDRDTQQQAFTTLMYEVIILLRNADSSLTNSLPLCSELLPRLDPAMVKEVYGLIEKNKKPVRSSTRRMLVLLIAALCRCHPVQAAKLLPRILSYACLRLRDRHAKTTDACVILVSAIALYVLPCPTISLPGASSPRRQRENISTQPFEAVAAVIAKETNAVGEAATRCLCGLLHPVDFDGVSVPGPSTIRAHATRIRPFFKTLLADTVAKMDGSTMFSAFSPLFLLLQSACQLARNAHEKGDFTQLGDEFSPYIGSIYEAIEDAFQCGPRNDWMLRKRSLELLTLLLDIFVLQEAAWCISVETAKGYFQAQVERVRALVLAGRHDSVSLVREAAIPATMAFECLEKMYPPTGSELQVKAPPSYDFVPPNPPGYSTRDSLTLPNESKSTSRLLQSDSIEDERFDHGEDDEALATDEITVNEDPAPVERKLTILARVDSGKITQASDNAQVFQPISQPATPVQDDERFTDLTMDYFAPEDSDETDPQQNEQSEEVQSKQRKGSRLTSDSDKSTPNQPVTEALQAVTSLKQFAAKKREQLRSRREQHEDIVQTALPRPQPSRTTEDSQRNQDDNHLENTSCSFELTRAEAALEAAQCGEFELAFRLCIVEDDLPLLRRTMSMIKTPCMETLSTMARNALCTAFLSLLDGDDGDVWLALQWLQQWAGFTRTDTRQLQQLDPRVSQALGSKLNDLAMASTKLALAAAHVVFLLEL